MTADEAAALFRTTADRLERIDSAEFGGAFLIVPPNDGGPPVDSLLVATTPKPVTFWCSLQGQVDQAVEEFKAEAERQSPQQHRGRR